MLKWIFAGLLAIIVLIVISIYTFGYFIKEHATEEGSFSAQVYESVMEGRIQRFCDQQMKRVPGIEEENSPAQIKATCRCFSDSMFEKVRDVSPDDLEDLLKQESIIKRAAVILEKCANQVGLN